MQSNLLLVMSFLHQRLVDLCMSCCSFWSVCFGVLAVSSLWEEGNFIMRPGCTSAVTTGRRAGSDALILLLAGAFQIRRCSLVYCMDWRPVLITEREDKEAGVRSIEH